jgi:hypothetical protein
MNDDTNLPPIENPESNRRTIILAMIGVVIFGICALFMLAFYWFRPNENTLFAKYFPSPTTTRAPTSTPAPTRAPAPNLTATQLAWIKPSQSPALGSADEAKKALESNMSYLEEFASIQPDMPEVNQPGDVYIYEIQLNQSELVIWSYGWCAATQKILEENFTHLQLEFLINEQVSLLENIFIQDTKREDGSPCREYTSTVNQWPQGQHQLEIHVTFTKPTDDGWNLYPEGAHTFKYIVTVN